MTDFSERRFSIDPGKGKKMDGCPYSIYEDGRDVQEYIIPPKGYVFVGFKFDPEASNQIYNGRLIAEYAKEPINERLKSNLWKVAFALAIIAVITVVVLLAANVFKDPKPAKPVDNKPNTEAVTAPVDTVQEAVASSTDTITETSEAESVAENETVQDPVATETETAPQVQETQADVVGPNVQFKQDFWNLIHQRTILMDAYDSLYKENKTQASGEEFDYLRYTILKNSEAFKEWSNKLRKVPASELENINTIDDLKKKLSTID